MKVWETIRSEQSAYDEWMKEWEARRVLAIIAERRKERLAVAGVKPYWLTEGF